MNTKINFRKWDAAEYLRTEKDVAEYLSAVAELDDVDLMNQAISDIARARGMTEIAKKAGVSREGLYRSFARGGNPEVKTLRKVLGAFGCRLSVEPLRV